MRRRWPLLAAVMAALVLSAAFGGPAQAGPEPEPKKTYKIVPYVISDPELIKNPERVSAEFKKNLSLDRLGIEPATADAPSRKTASRSRSAADPASYVTDSLVFEGGKKPADKDLFDYTDAAECDRQAFRAAQDAGWIKNRYSYCQIHEVYMPAVECELIVVVGCEVVGEFRSTNMLIGQGRLSGPDGQHNWRYADFTLHVDITKADGPWEEEAAAMTAIMMCDGAYRDPVIPVNDRNACDRGSVSDIGKRRTLTEWKANREATWTLRSESATPGEQNGEQIATGVFQIQYDFQIPWWIQFKEAAGPEGGLRFDSAWYLNVGPGESLGAVFDRAVPGIALDTADVDLNKGVADAAKHIEDARAHPSESIPLKPNKVLKGATANDPLHRLPGAKSAYHDRRSKDNRAASGRFCDPNDKPHDDLPYDCDEYPMASTYEGAAGGESNYQEADQEAGRAVQQAFDFSSKWVYSTHNQEAGRRIGRFYEVHRLLDYDHFTVQTFDSGNGFPYPDIPPAGDAPPRVSAGPDRTGDEGVPVGLQGLARDDNGTPTARWSYAAGDNVDNGATCTFGDAGTPSTTFTCTDDGTFTVTLTADDGVNAPASDSATVTLRNVAPSFRNINLPGDDTASAATRTPVKNKASSAAVATVSPTQWPVYRARTAVELTIPFTDPGSNDTHTCTVGWDDGQTESFPAKGHTCTTTHTFTDAGMYTLDITVRDDDGGANKSDSGNMIVIYDPDAGTANIDGSTTTPAGALVGEPSATGLTWIHNTAQYQTSNSATPVGQGKAWTDGTGFRLEPSGIEWLVLTKDGKVASRGTGTIGGRAGYTWVIYGWDACQNGRSDCITIPNDRARLVVFETATGTVVYDHSPGSTEFDVDRINPRDLTSGAVQVHRNVR